MERKETKDYGKYDRIVADLLGRIITNTNDIYISNFDPSSDFDMFLLSINNMANTFKEGTGAVKIKMPLIKYLLFKLRNKDIRNSIARVGKNYCKKTSYDLRDIIGIFFGEEYQSVFGDIYKEYYEVK